MLVQFFEGDRWLDTLDDSPVSPSKGETVTVFDRRTEKPNIRPEKVTGQVVDISLDYTNDTLCVFLRVEHDA